jgi:acyl-CoA synthetase (AMP-forming)/AMP-acid ligase II/acyl carrier protein
MQEYYELSPLDRVLQFAALNFDASLEQILPTLIAGARLVLRDANVWTPSEFHHKVAHYDLTVINLPTVYWQELAQFWSEEPEKIPAAGLRLVIIGGDEMHLETLRRWQKSRMNGVRLLNAYGPTETTITATTFEIPANFSTATERHRVPIGRPLANRKTYILDRSGQPVPIGIPGELYLGGDGLARGYLHRPELTAERFIPDSFAEQPGARLYKTGDLARYLSDGSIEFLGRVDYQVKIRGFRIELGEIEAALRQHPAVQQTVVLAREDRPGEKRLVAYLVAAPEKRPTVSELRSYLKDKLPEFMIPTAFVMLDKFPQTPSGKVDQRALPAPAESRPELESAFVAPRTPTETLLAEIVSEVLHVAQVGIHDNFFDLGGHSMLATQVISQVRDIFQVEVPLRKIFETPTVEGLALAIAHAQAEQEDREKLEKMLADLDQLSDAEVQKLLQQEESSLV